MAGKPAQSCAWHDQGLHAQSQRVAMGSPGHWEIRTTLRNRDVRPGVTTSVPVVLVGDPLAYVRRRSWRLNPDLSRMAKPGDHLGNGSAPRAWRKAGRRNSSPDRSAYLNR